ncbi:hypothetical protein OG339_47405 (plasmid) [Streptosporangium sp. NBC_01495]|uniref:hypothetical protein n=1 Tax=Streptosporangium sp. NBC_01495 TaxID=2903899 RepID=UPI002E2EE601|nr:hypothetical protein [Streptosporangium sp. NBC_01495]
MIAAESPTAANAATSSPRGVPPAGLYLSSTTDASRVTRKFQHTRHDARTDNGQRTFHVDRIVEAVVTELARLGPELIERYAT